MPKKRKKSTAQCSPQESLARHRNDYLKKLDVFCKAVTGENVLQMIPKNILERIFLLRGRTVIVEAEEGHEIHPKFIEVIKKLTHNCLKQSIITIEKTQNNVSLWDIYSMGLPLSGYLTYCERKIFKDIQVVRDLLDSSMGDTSYLFDLIYDKLQDEIFNYLIAVSNNICHHYYSYRIISASNEDDLTVVFRLAVSKYPSEKININIDNNVRPAFRIGWTFKSNEFEWLFITPAHLGIKTSFDNLQIPVYIQMHALQRLFERIDCIFPSFILVNVYLSLREHQVIKEKDKFLIELKMWNVKVGYLVAVMLEGKLVIRTFLFLTCNGTPEGKRLETIIGLQKADSEYLKMDKLSSFMSPKLKANEELQQLMKKADCLHLLHLHEQLDNLSSIHYESSPLEKLSDYLKPLENQMDAHPFDERMSCMNMC